MNCKPLRQIFLPTLLLVTLVTTNRTGNSESRKAQAVPADLGSAARCISDAQVSASLQALSMGTYDDQQRAVAHLKANARRSTACRNQTITGLMLAMNQPKLDLTGGTPRFYLWHYGTRLLGELKATESLDLLISHFDLNDGTGFPLNHYPALGGVIDMGEIALPKLKAVLRLNEDRYTRRHIVFCIGLIGGKFAHQILQDAVKSESDPCVRSCIQATLIEFNNKRRPHQISDGGRTKWYTTFICNGE